MLMLGDKEGDKLSDNEGDKEGDKLSDNDGLMLGDRLGLIL